MSASELPIHALIPAQSAQLRIWTGSQHLATPSAYMGTPQQYQTTSLAPDFHPHNLSTTQPWATVDAVSMSLILAAYYAAWLS